MNIFTIDDDNNITLSASAAEATERRAGMESFHSLQELAGLAAQWPTSRLLAIWNSLPGVEPVKRFTDRKTAVARIWRAIQGLGGGKPAATSGSPSRQRAHKATSRRAAHTGPKASKTTRVIALLRQPGGASLKEIMKATGWQAHSVRGFISGQLGKRMGLRVKSFERDGERVYAIRN